MKLNRIKEIVDRMATKIGVTTNDENNNENNFDDLKTKLLVIEKYLMVKETLIGMKETIGDFQAAVSGGGSQEDGASQRSITIDPNYMECVSIDAIERLGDFEYNIQKEAFMCGVCDDSAGNYSVTLEEDFEGKKQSREFINLKKSLKRHLNIKKHINNVNKEEVKEKMQKKLVAREKKISLVLGDVAYFLLKQGRPYTDFPVHVNLLSRAGVDVGDLNHSFQFVRHWSPMCAEVVDKRMTTFFHTVMPQTGLRPVAKVVADKGTWKHESRMLCGLVTVVPDSEEPLQAFFISSKACPEGSGEAQTRSILCVKKYLVEKYQYLGLAADGATLYCGVGRRLGEHFERIGHDDYDLVHKAGRVDVHMRADLRFKFIPDVAELISAIYKMVSYRRFLCHNYFSRLTLGTSTTTWPLLLRSWQLVEKWR